jgi:hypothetical protein
MTYEETVNKTARAAGAVGARALVPRKVRELTEESKGIRILDYGSGPQAMHAIALRNDGWDNVTAHEIGANVTDLHDPDALGRNYHVVMASNVLNVQPTRADLRNVLLQIRVAVKKGGFAVVNFPESPRKNKTTVEELESLLEWLFGSCSRIGGTKRAPVFLCRADDRCFDCGGPMPERGEQRVGQLCPHCAF